MSKELASNHKILPSDERLLYLSISRINFELFNRELKMQYFCILISLFFDFVGQPRKRSIYRYMFGRHLYEAQKWKTSICFQVRT